jgi:hypothetical protein
MLDGGFIRDSLMGVTGGKDIDMEVYGISDPDVLIAALNGVGFGIAFAAREVQKHALERHRRACAELGVTS